jgi:hypothetical protein
MGADAINGVDVDYESIQIGQGGSMLMVSASGRQSCSNELLIMMQYDCTAFKKSMRGLSLLCTNI